MKGELHPAVKHLWGGLRHIVRTFLDMDDSIVWFDLFLVGLYRGGGGDSSLDTYFGHHAVVVVDSR